MRPRALFALFAAGAIKASAQQAPPFSGNAPAKKVACDTSGANFPASHIDKTAETKWTHNFMYPFKVCVEAKGLDNVELKCDHDRKAHITLEILPAGAKEHVQNNFEFDVSKITPKGIECHTFLVSEIVTNMAGKTPGATKWGAHSIIFGKLKDATKESTSQVSVMVAPYRFEAPGTLTAHKGDYKEHGVVCSFANCKIEAIGGYEKMSVERFKVTAGKTPTLEKGEGALGANMFSVTLFECKDKCPTSFKAVQSSAPAAALYLSIATVIAAVFFVSEA